MRVLIIDDEPATRGAMRALLEQAGFVVAEASGGEEGLRAFAQDGADVVLCDLFMPDMDGLQAIQEFRCRFPGVKVVAVSGGGLAGRVDMLAAARFMGADGVLHKPFDMAAAVTEIGRVMSGAV